MDQTLKQKIYFANSFFLTAKYFKKGVIQS